MLSARSAQISARLVAVGRLDPQQQAKTGGGGPRVLDHDLQVGRGERVEGRGRLRQLGLVIDEGEPAPVEGQEQRVVPSRPAGHAQPVWPCGAKRPVAARRRSGWCRGQGRHRPRSRAPSSWTRARSAAPSPAAHELQVAGAGRLERRLDRGAGAPFGDETVIGHGRSGRACLAASAGVAMTEGPQQGVDGSHRSSSMMADGMVGDGEAHAPSLRRYYPVQVQRVRLRISALCQGTPR